MISIDFSSNATITIVVLHSSSLDYSRWSGAEYSTCIQKRESSRMLCIFRPIFINTIALGSYSNDVFMVT